MSKTKQAKVIWLELLLQLTAREALLIKLTEELTACEYLSGSGYELIMCTCHAASAAIARVRTCAG